MYTEEYSTRHICLHCGWIADLLNVTVSFLFHAKLTLTAIVAVIIFIVALNLILRYVDERMFARESLHRI